MRVNVAIGRCDFAVYDSSRPLWRVAGGLVGISHGSFDLVTIDLIIFASNRHCTSACEQEIRESNDQFAASGDSVVGTTGAEIEFKGFRESGADGSLRNRSAGNIAGLAQIGRTRFECRFIDGGFDRDLEILVVDFIDYRCGTEQFGVVEVLDRVVVIVIARVKSECGKSDCEAKLEFFHTFRLNVVVFLR